MLLTGSYAVHGLVEYYLKANCDKLKMYAVTPKVTATNRQQDVYFVSKKENKIK